MTNATPQASGAAANRTNAPRARRRAVHIALWVLQLALALMFLGAAMGKLTGEAAAVDMFDELGTGQWLRYVVGGLELAAAIGLLLPRVRSLAALGLAALMLCAAIISLAALDESPAAALAFMAVAAVIAAARWSEARVLTKRFA